MTLSNQNYHIPRSGSFNVERQTRIQAPTALETKRVFEELRLRGAKFLTGDAAASRHRTNRDPRSRSARCPSATPTRQSVLRDEPRTRQDVSNPTPLVDNGMDAYQSGGKGLGFDDPGTIPLSIRGSGVHFGASGALPSRGESHGSGPGLPGPPNAPNGGWSKPAQLREA